MSSSFSLNNSSSYRSPLSGTEGLSNSSRKRARSGGSSKPNPYPSGARPVASPDLSDLGASTYSCGGTSPGPLANDRYYLQGGVDTPIRNATRQYESVDGSSESDFGRRWTSPQHDEGRQTRRGGALQREGNGRKRGRTVSGEDCAQETSWGRYVFSVVGGIASKVLDFCTAGTFKGFMAGGGPGYIMGDAAPRLIEHYRSPWEDSYHECHGHERVSGGLRSDEFEDGDGEVEQFRPAKRQHTGSNNDWVMVESHSQGTPQSTFNYLHSSPPRRAASRVTIKPASIRRPKTSTARLASISYARSPQSAPSHKRAASFASGRSPGPSPSQHHQQPHEQQTSPLRASVDLDLQEYSAKRQREAKQSDASIRRLNDQLQAMIKQGQQALHSKVEVHEHSAEDDDIDEGYVEGYECDEQSYGWK